MSDWKFTDQYGSAYPALANNSILGVLVFDITGSSPVAGTSFTGALDLPKSGTALNILAALTGMTSIPFTGTVTTDNNTLTVSLTAGGAAITQAFAAAIPIIGGSVCKNAVLSIDSVIPASLAADDCPATDTMGLGITIAVGSGTGTVVTQIPMSDGFFTLNGTFENFGIGLSDLNFLVPGSNNFSAGFPSAELGPYYNNETQLELLKLSFDVYVSADPSLSIEMSGIGVSIGITNLAIYQQALYLDPLAVWIHIADMNTPDPLYTWGLEGDFVLCNYNRPGDTQNPDFTFNLNMAFPNPPQQPDFSLSGSYGNPYNQPVSQIVSDLIGQEVDLGIGNTITLEKFDFSTNANVTTGLISNFEFEIGMSGPFGLFESFQLNSFSLAVAYSS